MDSTAESHTDGNCSSVEFPSMIVEDVTGGRVGGASVGGFVSKFSGLGVGMGRASVCCGASEFAGSCGGVCAVVASGRIGVRAGSGGGIGEFSGSGGRIGVRAGSGGGIGEFSGSGGGIGVYAGSRGGIDEIAGLGGGVGAVAGSGGGIDEIAGLGCGVGAVVGSSGGVGKFSCSGDGVGDFAGLDGGVGDTRLRGRISSWDLSSGLGEVAGLSGSVLVGGAVIARIKLPEPENILEHL